MVKRMMLLALLASCLMSCGNDDSPVLTASEQLAIDREIIEDFVATQGVDSVLTTPSGLTYFFTQLGNGPVPQTGQVVTVHYEGTFLDGEVFDSSYDRGQPFSFQLGVGQVIPGWDLGIGLMPVGSLATLVIPSGLAYGPRGTGPIGPNTVLLFDVEVLSVQ